MMTKRQKRFCDEYLIDLNATQAAIRSGYSKRTARSQGQRLLTKVDIQKRISNLQEKIQERTQIDQDWVIKRLVQLADYDVKKLFDKKGKLIKVPELPEEITRAIVGIKIRQTKDKAGRTRTDYVYKLANKNSALDSIRDTLGFKSTLHVDHTTKGESLNNGFYELLKLTSLDQNEEDESE